MGFSTASERQFTVRKQGRIYLEEEGSNHHQARDRRDKSARPTEQEETNFFLLHSFHLKLTTVRSEGRIKIEYKFNKMQCSGFGLFIQKNLHLNKFKIEFSSSKAFPPVEAVKLERHEARSWIPASSHDFSLWTPGGPMSAFSLHTDHQVSAFEETGNQ